VKNKFLVGLFLAPFFFLVSNAFALTGQFDFEENSVSERVRCFFEGRLYADCYSESGVYGRLLVNDIVEVAPSVELFRFEYFEQGGTDRVAGYILQRIPGDWRVGFGEWERRAGGVVISEGSVGYIASAVEIYVS
jgi:hypothetical protein